MLSISRDGPEYLSVIASLPAEQTTFEYLVGCWKRGNKIRSDLLAEVIGDPQILIVSGLNFAQEFPPADTQQAANLLDKLRALVINYTGLTLREPRKFPQPPTWVVPRHLFSSTHRMP